MVALYFGSSGYLKFVKTGNKTDENNEYFSLWILNTDYLPHNEIGLIDLPKAINQRIALQRGCFTNVRQFPAENSQKSRIIYQHLKPDSPFREDYILLQEVLSQHHLDYTLLKINIPTSLAYSTFKHCDHMGFNAATLLKDIKVYMNEYNILKNHEST